MTGFIVIGALALVAGLGLVATGVRKHEGQRPTAFGLVLAGFAIAYQNAAPLDLNAGAAR